ncbi:MAG: hypothetical protein AB199_00420 [Parcubacteria bacterium C7867-004]|nr:MAG: hypothetical protein AB199_00420 [Parcubacteria bacterium C7867-004]
MKYIPLLVLALFISTPLIAGAAVDTSFVPLTQNAPFLEGLGKSSSLPLFLNNLYRICIGLAAVIAVLQIMRAGIMYMGGDSFTEKKEAKNLIAMAIGGLILVLSPVVVFSIINPDILSLKIGGLGKLDTSTTSNFGPSAELGDGTCSVTCAIGKICKNKACVKAPAGSCTTIPNGVKVVTAAEQTCCASQAGCKVQLSTTNALSDPTCNCTPPAAAATYGWRGKFEPDGGGTATTQQQGPFTTQAACDKSLQEWPTKNKLASTGEFQCDCRKPLSQQTNCTF